jgi:methionyl-tRNA formyltransferase
MRILFAGSPAIAVPSLKALFEMETAGALELAGILTNPDSPRGRKGIVEPTDVSAAAAELSRLRMEKGLPPIPQIKAEKLGAGEREEAAALKADLLVSFAYGRIFGPKFLSLFPLGGVNVHPSLLPRHRGPTPIQGAILSGDRETGVSVQRLALEMDAGDILAWKSFPLTGREDAASLSGRAAEEAAALLPGVVRGTLAGKPQEGTPTYTSLIVKEDGLVDWNRGAVEIDARVRAFTPWPLSFTHLDGQTLYILEGSAVGSDLSPVNSGGPPVPGSVLGIDRSRGILVQTGNGIYAVSRLQWQAKKALDWKAFLNGARNFIGSALC